MALFHKAEQQYRQIRTRVHTALSAAIKTIGTTLPMKACEYIILSVATAICIAAATDSYAQRRNTTRKPLKASSVHVAKATDTVACDTIVSPTGWIEISGYEKPVSSRRESALFTNKSGQTVTSLRIAITYSDMQNRELHARRVRIRCDIPAGATRQLYWRTWDYQHSFYYHRSKRPSRQQATPYKITCSIDTLTAL